MKVKWSGMGAVDGRGKIGGTVGSRNRSGAYLRVKVTPVNPQSVAQMAVRSILAALAAGWAALLQAERDTWDAATYRWQRTDIFGDLREPTGQQLYMRLNASLENAGLPTLTVAPVPQGTDRPTVSDGGGGYTAGTATLDITNDLTGSQLVIEATPPVSAGRKYLKNLYRRIYSAPGAVPQIFDVTTEYEARFGAAPVGSRVGFRVLTINPNTGEQSVPYEVQYIVN